MPLTQENRLDSKFSNNNDQSYLHKKFKKMASTISVFPATSMVGENLHKDANVSNSNTLISNGSIASSHPEIEKIKLKQDTSDNSNEDLKKNVQINYNDENIRISNVNNVHVSGQTSFTEEFSNKTDNLENDFLRDSYTGGVGGRYICPYCKLSCAKPSVLQKHIRAHTNERPYPCVPCGFAFKTKSNLYKHRRSRTHALRLQGNDVSTAINDEDLSGGSESDTSMPPTQFSDFSSDASVRQESIRSTEFSSPELISDGYTQTSLASSLNDISKSKTIYKPKFRVAFYQDNDDKDKTKKSIAPNADFLTEHISKIISDNEAIIDVIETPLQKKYGKIKQIAESKQYLNEGHDHKAESSPLNLTKACNEPDNNFRKRSHSESFSQTDSQKHPLNPEGSIIKDLLLKTKSNGLNMAPGELIDGHGLLYVCPLCQITYRSADNLEIHRMYYCKGSMTQTMNVGPKEPKLGRPENMYVRSNSINVCLPEGQPYSKKNIHKTAPLKTKPDNLILKSETNEIIAPLPSPGPLLGNTRLVDTKSSNEMPRKNDNLKLKPLVSPKRRIDRTDNYSPRLIENVSPRLMDFHVQPKIRCIEANSPNLRTIEEILPHMRHNSTSLQMFGGEVKIVDHSGGTTTLRIEPSKNQLSPILIQQSVSPSKISNESEASSVVVRSGLHSGGTIVHNPPTPKETMCASQTPRMSNTSTTNSNLPNLHDISHFQFPPLSAITAYNPLTLPPLSPVSSPNGATTILHGGKLIPHVPGMPGPNSPGVFVGSPSVANKPFIKAEAVKQNTKGHREDVMRMNVSQQTKTSPAPKYESFQNSRSTYLTNERSQEQSDVSQYVTTIPVIKVKNVDESDSIKTLMPSVSKSIGNRQENYSKEITNFISNKGKGKEKIQTKFNSSIKHESDIRNFNFETMITKAEIFNNQMLNSDVQNNLNFHDSSVDSLSHERSETSYFQKNLNGKSVTEDRKPKFLRPTTLPLKPGTFTPKRHHGITPNANTMPLVSPETPRPSKAYGQLYLNGNAYTYLGLKCSTKVFYCTINRPQPTYVPNQHFLSMYSNWQLLSELTPDPLGLSASLAMSLYDSRHRPQNMAISVIKQDLIVTHSSQWNENNKDSKQALSTVDSKKIEENKLSSIENASSNKKELAGGFESNEEYTYVRGRGRGRYVCSECGIRCKKPSMLKKHIRTHTDVRPYTCIHCAFSFKTKGNLTKHMKSKAHYKKCCELGINPNEGNDVEGGEMNQCSGETDDETESDGDEGNEGETESSDTETCKSRLPEHEAAHCLLSLGSSRPTTSAAPGLLTSARPSTYPYTPIGLENLNLEVTPERSFGRSASVESRVDTEYEPMDLSKSDSKISQITEIPTAIESSVLASLASNTAKLPQPQSQWSNGEPMLHTYLTERALFDSKIKQSQLTSSLSKVRKIDLDKSVFVDSKISNNTETVGSTTNIVCTSSPDPKTTIESNSEKLDLTASKEEANVTDKESPTASSATSDFKIVHTPNNTNAENAKHVVSEYLKQARINLIKSHDEVRQTSVDGSVDDNNKLNIDETIKNDECSTSDNESIKLSSLDHDPVARKVVIGVGGVAFKVTKGKDFEGTSTFPPGRLMEDGRRVCDFCNKTFTKPSQLRLHLNIHYMERPFRCSVCAVSFRTRGHLQKHERSGSHHNKVSMTSTFGAATSFNPRPFRCSDCNIAFRIHGHLAKHLRSKMHVMRLECLFKLPFGTFTEIERAGVSLTDIDTSDCASSLASLQSLARKLHEKDPTKLEYRDPSSVLGDEDGSMVCEKTSDLERDSDKIDENGDSQENEIKVNCSATDI